LASTDGGDTCINTTSGRFTPDTDPGQLVRPVLLGLIGGIATMCIGAAAPYEKKKSGASLGAK
jgi:hypothetical protein